MTGSSPGTAFSGCGSYSSHLAVSLTGGELTRSAEWCDLDRSSRDLKTVSSDSPTFEKKRWSEGRTGFASSTRKLWVDEMTLLRSNWNEKETGKR